jgi:hypothetical protein
LQACHFITEFLLNKTGMDMGHLLIRYLMVFLIGYVLFAIHARANTHKTNMGYSVPQLESGQAKLVDLATLPPQLARTVDDEAHGLESDGERVLPPANVSPSDLAAFALAGVGQDVLADGGRDYGKAWLLRMAEAID